ncbi:terpene synthase [Rhizoctonia solani]|uniref:Terpene synthase n=1 Tax=Rhizoctonia solani TaxID=456999 RepID=A0A8H8NWC1_9AGAM|nr:terpene synthase [Rhizoctonia solani]QRW20740.1 terpene synthase [Rhizoctonia solani]
MSSISTLHQTERSLLPPSIIIPDTVGHTRDIFALKLNPHHEEAEAGSLAWFDNYDLHAGPHREEFLSARYCLLASYCYPDADLGHLRPVMDFIIWLVAYDDMADDGEFCDSIEALKHAFGITLKFLRNPDAPHPNLKYLAALKSFYNRMRENGNPAALCRFVEGAEGYMQAALQDTMNRAAGKVLTIDEYIHLRAESSGVKWAYAALEYAHEIELPNKVHEDPIVSELALAGNQILTWSNDIYSFSLEQAKGYTHNILFVIMWNKQVDLQAAVDFVERMIQKRVKEYIDAKALLPSFGPEIDHQVAKYIQGIEHCIQANISWSLMSPRYFGADFEKVKETRIVNLMAPIISTNKRSTGVKEVEPMEPIAPTIAVAAGE